MVYGLYVISPVSGLYCHRCRARTGGPDGRQGRGARTTRFRRTLQAFRPASKTRLTPQRPSQPAPTLRDDAHRPLWRPGLTGNIVLIYVIVNAPTSVF